MVRKQTPFRCVAQKGWYFVAQEVRIGPFETRREAEASYRYYVHELTRARQKPPQEASAKPRAHRPDE